MSGILIAIAIRFKILTIKALDQHASKDLTYDCSGTLVGVVHKEINLKSSLQILHDDLTALVRHKQAKKCLPNAT